MGMDYYYSGSASYSRFNDEVSEIAKVFNGVKKETKFVFPSKTNSILVHWFNNIYNEFTPEETEVIWNYIFMHPEIKNISPQLWNELSILVELGEGWEIR
jgi:hypothetical protein